MKLVKGNGQTRCNCKRCNKLIAGNDYKYIAKEGVLCVYHGRVDSLYFGFRNWLKGYLNAAL